MEIQDILERFQAHLDPLTGSLRLEAYWVKVVEPIAPPGPSIVGPLEQGVSRSYGSLTSANEAALAFPAFPAIAERFTTEPFTAIADLLDALREIQEREAAEATDTPPFPLPQEPPFEGAS